METEGTPILLVVARVQIQVSIPQVAAAEVLEIVELQAVALEVQTEGVQVEEMEISQDTQQQAEERVHLI
jgi:hypothetical protein